MAGIPALKTDYAQLRTRMDKAVLDFQTNLGSIRTGRASIHMLDQVKVDYYGTPTPLNQVGQITTPPFFKHKIASLSDCCDGLLIFMF